MSAFHHTSPCILLLFIFGETLWTPEGSIAGDDVTASIPPHSTKPSGAYNVTINCDELLPGQYFCEDPNINEDTQQANGCSEDTREVNVRCFPVPGLDCKTLIHEGDQSFFYSKVPCKWTNGKRFSIALLLSVFLGWLGIDRFYLGYPAIGMLKFCTFGFMFLGHLVDILLIAIQVVTPADGSAYIVDYYGAGLVRIDSNNETYIKPPNYS